MITLQPGEKCEFRCSIPRDAISRDHLQELMRASEGDFTTTFHDEFIGLLLRRKRIALTKVPRTQVGRFLWNLLGGRRYWRLKKKPYLVATCDRTSASPPP